MNRRTFLTSMLAACAAPAIVRADSLMRIVARDVTVFRPYDFTDEMQRFIVLDSNPIVTNSWMRTYYGESICAIAMRARNEQIDREVMKCLTTEFEAPKFRAETSSLVQRKQ